MPQASIKVLLPMNSLLRPWRGETVRWICSALFCFSATLLCPALLLCCSALPCFVALLCPGLLLCCTAALLYPSLFLCCSALPAVCPDYSVTGHWPVLDTSWDTAVITEHLTAARQVLLHLWVINRARKYRIRETLNLSMQCNAMQCNAMQCNVCR